MRATLLQGIDMGTAHHQWRMLLHSRLFTHQNRWESNSAPTSTIYCSWLLVHCSASTVVDRHGNGALL
eukprot:8230207-Pyramimonas_sp.AAC.1